MPDPKEADTPISPVAADARLTPGGVAPPPPPAGTEAVVEPPADESTDEAKERKRWAKAVVIVGNHRIPEGKRPVIIVEGRDYEMEASEDKSDPNPVIKSVAVRKEGYPGGADVYFRTDPEVDFGEKNAGKVITMGVDVMQGPFHGFSEDPAVLHYGPAHPAYAAANLAFIRGAKEIEIIGLEEHEKKRLEPWIEGLKVGGGPRDAQRLNLYPADIKIVLA